jgi:hypothetical protein
LLQSVANTNNFVICFELYLPETIFSCSPLMLISFNSNPIAIGSTFVSAAVADASVLLARNSLHSFFLIFAKIKIGG